MCRDREWMSTLEDTSKQYDVWRSTVADFKEVERSVRVTALGLKKQALGQRRSVAHRTNRVAAQFAQGGFPKVLAGMRATVAHAKVGSIVATTSSKLSSTSPFIIDSADALPQWTKVIKEIEAALPKLAQDACDMEKQMRSNTIMKPWPALTIDASVYEELMLFDGVDEPEKSWLLVAENSQWCAGQFRWPCMGMATFVTPLTSPIVIGLMPMAQFLLG